MLGWPGTTQYKSYFSNPPSIQSPLVLVQYVRLEILDVPSQLVCAAISMWPSQARPRRLAAVNKGLQSPDHQTRRYIFMFKWLAPLLNLLTEISNSHTQHYSLDLGKYDCMHWEKGPRHFLTLSTVGRGFLPNQISLLRHIIWHWYPGYLAVVLLLRGSCGCPIPAVRLMGI